MRNYRSTQNGVEITDSTKKENLLKEIKNNKYKTELVSFTGENEFGLPVMKIKYGDSENNGIVEIELDDLYTEGSFSKNVDNYVMDKFEEHGGIDGKIIAARARDRIDFKNIIPNTLPDFRESNEIKNIVSTKIKDKLQSQTNGEDYELDIVTNNTSDSNKEYTIQIGDGNGNSHSLTWDRLMSTPEELSKIGNIKIYRYLSDKAVSYTHLTLPTTPYV